jgi:hypothetical protein
MFLSENWLHFSNFSENSQRHHYAADASFYLVNIKQQIYYAHRQIFFLIFFTTGVHYLPSIKCRLGVIQEVLLNMQWSDHAHITDPTSVQNQIIHAVYYDCVCVYIELVVVL